MSFLKRKNFQHLFGHSFLKSSSENDEDKQDNNAEDEDDTDAEDEQEDTKSRRSKKAKHAKTHSADNDDDTSAEDDDDAEAEDEEEDTKSRRSKKAKRAKARKADDDDEDTDAEDEDEDNTAESDDERKEARAMERRRCKNIFLSKAAGINPSLAAHLAFNTSLPSKQAIVILNDATAGQALAHHQQTLRQKMQSHRLNPIGQDQKVKSVTAHPLANQMLAAAKKARGH
ncbi:hypothetical protein [Entomobacter blattae]|uniref:Uncharacterized protein n=1 Tax=Entomobacter blattae TaxID=2762277 RepID=A0A7H1NUH4_9PROT|nr:hypothetical protein [Entomobacter blattae]QNT79434.1 hypothetical protein JGUZn3_22330 [Entomobacter blattae]